VRDQGSGQRRGDRRSRRTRQTSAGVPKYPALVPGDRESGVGLWASSSHRLSLSPSAIGIRIQPLGLTRGHAVGIEADGYLVQDGWKDSSERCYCRKASRKTGRHTWRVQEKRVARFEHSPGLEDARVENKIY
jgi:hypothetical protein